jgi:N-acetylglucosamine-6-phosphate deacetylase
MEAPHVMPELICDGVHIAPAAVRAAFSMFGKERLVFISDSMMATGMPDGEYTLGGLDVHVKGNRATLWDGTLAGSVTNLFDCMRTAVRSMGIPLETAVAAATLHPAQSIGEEAQYGSIEVGKYADLLLLDCETLEIKQVISHGILVR